METFRPIDLEGFHNCYRVGDCGTVVSNRDFKRTSVGRVLTQATRAGVKVVTLSHWGHTRTLRVHRLVASAFLGTPPTPQHQAIHLDGDLTNNRASNLAWGLPKRHGLGESKARAVHAAYQDGKSTYQIANDLGVSHTAVSRILSGDHYSRLGLTTPTRGNRPFITTAAIKQMVALRAAGVPNSDIAAQIGCSKQHVYTLLNRGRHG